MVHEAGHLIAAKIFNVYCFEYSIGFGPKIVSFKRKTAETAFSLRAIPFGGYVSMYGEKDSIPEGMDPIDESRSLYHIKKWKRIIVLIAGIFMNFVLALTLFFVYEVAFPKYVAHYGHVFVDANSIAEDIGVQNEELVFAELYSYGDDTYVFYDDEAVLNYPDSVNLPVYFGYKYSGIQSQNDTSLYTHAVAFSKSTVDNINGSEYVSRSISDIINTEYDESDETLYNVSGYLLATQLNQDEKLIFFVVAENYSDTDFIVFVINYDDENLALLASLPVGNRVSVAGRLGRVTSTDTDGNKTFINSVECDTSHYEFSYPDVFKGNMLSQKHDDKEPQSLSFAITSLKEEEETHIGKGSVQHKFLNLSLEEKDGVYRLPSNVGIHMYFETIRNNFGQAVGQTFYDFGYSAGVIYKSLGMLLTSANAWKEVGGIVAIGVTATNILTQNGVGPFIYFWALISVNLGIMNLLPFPGLDGWQIVVTIVEGITKKEMPQKAKTIVTIIGLVLLFAFMAFVLVKDLIFYVF